MNSTDSQHRDPLEERVQEVLSKLVLKTTGISKHDRKDPIQYVSSLFLRIRNVEYLKRFQADISQLRSTRASSLDPSSQILLIECFNRVVNCIETGVVNEITINALRKCFISLATEISVLNKEHALSVLEKCTQLSAGEILVLQAYYDAETNTETTRQIKNWFAALSQHTGIELIERLETHLSSLTQKKLLQKNAPSTNNPGKTHNLSELGSAIALSIDHGEKFLRYNLNFPSTNV